ncbi:LemA [Candidatus Omnitrophus magneticus]|uniref:LemA n=1 Tax=Candidatus Omnitrophus magneticus TaxID=1609969 RepID=A0A0F0CWN1_9BACT|nr:LemA [Candidatus Omnitrophus magneticus]
MKNLWTLLSVVIIIFLIIGLWFINGLNYVVKLDEAVRSSWAQVENQLQRRNDLIPNLVNTVKGYAVHEKDLFTKITELRSQWGKASTEKEKIATANEMSGIISRLLVVSENYPDLKANQNFINLQAQLEGTENRIAVERMRYNRMVESFNSYKRTVFGGLFCSIRGLNAPHEYFSASKDAKNVPVVSF